MNGKKVMRKPVEKLIINFFVFNIWFRLKKANVLIKIINSNKKMYHKIVSGTKIFMIYEHLN